MHQLVDGTVRPQAPRAGRLAYSGAQHSARRNVLTRCVCPEHSGDDGLASGHIKDAFARIAAAGPETVLGPTPHTEGPCLLASGESSGRLVSGYGLGPGSNERYPRVMLVVAVRCVRVGPDCPVSPHTPLLGMTEPWGIVPIGLRILGAMSGIEISSQTHLGRPSRQTGVPSLTERAGHGLGGPANV